MGVTNYSDGTYLRVYRQIDGRVVQAYFPVDRRHDAYALDARLQQEQAAARHARLARLEQKRTSSSKARIRTGVRGVSLRCRGDGYWSVVVQTAHLNRSFSIHRLGLKAAWRQAMDALCATLVVTDPKTRRQLLRRQPPPPPRMQRRTRGAKRVKP